MLTYDEIEQLSKDDQAVTHASHEYYRALLGGASKDQRQRLLKVWRRELQRRWPDICPIKCYGGDSTTLSETQVHPFSSQTRSQIHEGTTYF